MSHQDAVDAVVPPLPGDNTRLYLGLRTATGRTRVLVEHLVGTERVEFLQHPALPCLARNDHLFGWGEHSTGGCMLAVALLTDACGPVACARLWPAFYDAVVRRLADDWELSEARVQMWASRQLMKREGGAAC